MAIKCIFGYRYLRDIEAGEEFSEYNTLLENLKNYYLITLKDEKFSNIKTRLLIQIIITVFDGIILQ